MSLDDALSDDHPLILELTSLRSAVEHYQHEAHNASVKLQRHSLETTTALERLRALEDASAFLQHELDVHRTFNGLPNSGGRASHQDSVQVQELTLALRRLSDKLSMTENSLLVRNEELVAMRKERDIAQRAKDLAYANSVRLRDELEELRAKEREWLNRVRMAEEERRVCPIFRSTPLQTYFLRLISDENRQLSDLVVEEYAELVRSLEGRSNSSFARNGTKENVNAVQTSLDGLMSARAGLQKLLEESNVDSENLHAEISRLHGALELAQISLGAEREISEDDKKKIALAQLELHRLEIDDNTAAKMVSRYMKFSQSSADVLHNAMESQKSRHAATLSTIQFRLQQSEERLAFEKQQTDRLRQALDEAAEDVSRETYGRRREVALRLALLRREETLSERLKRWILKSQELLCKVSSTDTTTLESLTSVFSSTVRSAETILSTLDNDSLNGESSRSLARCIAACATVKSLKNELQRETDKRLALERQVALLEHNSDKQKQPTDNSQDYDQVKCTQFDVATTPQQAFLAKGVTEVPGSSQTCVHQPTFVESAPAGSIHSAVTSMSISPKSEDANAMVHGVLQTSISASNIDESKDTALSFSERQNLLLLLREDTLTRPDDENVETRSVRNSVDATAMDAITQMPVVNEEEVDANITTMLGLHHGVNDTINRDIDPNVSSLLDEQDNEGLGPYAPVEHPNTGREVLEPDGKMQLLAVRVKREEKLAALSSLSPIVVSNSAKTFREKVDECKSASERAGSSSTFVSLYPEFSPSANNQLVPFPSCRDTSSVHNHSTIEESKVDQNLHTLDSVCIKMLSELDNVSNRYDELQNSFQSCHTTLQALKNTVHELANPSSVFHIAVDRLDDYCEDARVELEIRVADEERITRGYQALLSIPGALSDEVNADQVKAQILQFAEGSDVGVQKAIEVLKHKLDDLQNDIAILKRALHETASSIDERDTSLAQGHRSVSGWVSWTNTFLTASRSPSPAPVPTFGAVVTSPRLYHAPPLQRFRPSSDDTQSAFAGLGLRIATPTTIFGRQAAQETIPRHRVSSTMFNVGIGRGGILTRPRSSLGVPNVDSTGASHLSVSDIEGDVD